MVLSNRHENRAEVEREACHQHLTLKCFKPSPARRARPQEEDRGSSESLYEGCGQSCQARAVRANALFASAHCSSRFRIVCDATLPYRTISSLRDRSLAGTANTAARMSTGLRSARPANWSRRRRSGRKPRRLRRTAMLLLLLYRLYS